MLIIKKYKRDYNGKQYSQLTLLILDLLLKAIFFALQMCLINDLLLKPPKIQSASRFPMDSLMSQMVLLHYFLLIKVSLILQSYKAFT